MPVQDLIAAGLIGIGALVMAASIVSYRANIRSSYHLFYKSSKNIYALYKIHLILMLFFLIGYLIVIYTIFRHVPIVGVPFIGAIFFFGAIFVYLGIRLQSIMFYSINLHTDEIVSKNDQLDQTENATIFALAYQAEMRDSGTGKHLERTSRYMRIIAEQMAQTSKYKAYLTADYIADLQKSAPLHDIGKVGIPDSILKKEGRLSAEEFGIIKGHCEMGASTLALAEKKLEFRSFLNMAISIARSHHEKWNGKGYPSGLRGEEIPLSARIMAVSDVYDALRSERCYKKAYSHKKAVKIITSESGEHFDPAVVAAFLAAEQEIVLVSTQLADLPPSPSEFQHRPDIGKEEPLAQSVG